MPITKQKVVTIARCIFSGVMLILSLIVAIQYPDVFIVSVAFMLVAGSTLYAEIDKLRKMK